jgi:hypothetical protein
MAFGLFDQFLQGFIGVDGLKDYSHAAKTFRTNGYEFAPRNKFLFHVFFTINTQQIPKLRTALFAGNQDQSTIGLMVKSAQLPTYSMTVETLNQYNRKRLAQTKIEYNPVQIEFHDDGGDLIRNMWYNYYSYYYKDPSQAYDSPNNQNGQIAQIQSPAGFSYNSRDIYENSRTVNDWGYIGESYDEGATSLLTGTPSGKPPFFRDIRIYGLYQKKWAEYILINPMITDWNHDTYDYSQGAGTMTNRCTIKYETVKYYSGAVGGVRPDTNVVGFADPAYYDTVPSALNRPGSTQSVLGQGGLLDAGIGIIEDLQSGGVAGLIGAAQKATASYYTFKDKNIRSIVNQEVIDTAKNVARTQLPGAVRAAIGTTNPTPGGPNRGALDGIFFPTAPRTGNTPPFNPSRF